jgi:hypothetical protein
VGVTSVCLDAKLGSLDFQKSSWECRHFIYRNAQLFYFRMSVVQVLLIAAVPYDLTPKFDGNTRFREGCNDAVTQGMEGTLRNGMASITSFLPKGATG